MQIDTKEIMSGRCNGQTVWICHYHRPDLDKKALRNIPPTKVLVRCNDKFPPKKAVYYSKSHFSPLSKAGLPLAKVISPVDNTGFRGRSGATLYVFDNEAECITAWNEQLAYHELVVDNLIANAAQRWKTEKNLLIEARM